MGLHLKSPLVVSANPLSEKGDNILKMEDAGAGAVLGGHGFGQAGAEGGGKACCHDRQSGGGEEKADGDREHERDHLVLSTLKSSGKPRSVLTFLL